MTWQIDYSGSWQSRVWLEPKLCFIVHPRQWSGETEQKRGRGKANREGWRLTSFLSYFARTWTSFFTLTFVCSSRNTIQDEFFPKECDKLSERERERQEQGKTETEVKPELRHTPNLPKTILSETPIEPPDCQIKVTDFSPKAKAQKHVATWISVKQPNWPGLYQTLLNLQRCTVTVTVTCKTSANHTHPVLRVEGYLLRQQGEDAPVSLVVW